MKHKNINDLKKKIENILKDNKAIEINSNHAGAYNNLGRIYTETGDFEKAISSHQAASKLEPENLIHDFYLSELNKNFLNSELKNKTEKILNNKKTYKINFVFGNFLLSRYARDEKKYEKEMDYFLKEICNDEWNKQQDCGRPISEAVEELVKKFPKYTSQIKLYYH